MPRVPLRGIDAPVLLQYELLRAGAAHQTYDLLPRSQGGLDSAGAGHGFSCEKAWRLTADLDGFGAAGWQRRWQPVVLGRSVRL